MQQQWWILICFLLSGCVQVFPEPEPSSQLINLQPTLPLQKSLSPLAWQLGVEEPLANTILNSTEIAIKTTSSSNTPYFTYLKGKEWGQRLPLMLQTLMIQAFDDSGKFKGVGRLSQGLKPDYVLLSEIDHFELEILQNTNQVTIKMGLRTKLMKIPGHELVASQVFYKRLPTSKQQFSMILATLEKALAEILVDVVGWAETSLKR